MKWWIHTSHPHPCIGGCGTILETPKAKRCRKCYRAHIAEEARVRYRERRERGVCIQCGRVPAFQGGGRCERHRERYLEHKRKARAERRWRNQKFVNCEICGALLRKNGNVKYCRPCSVDRNGAWHLRRRRKQFKETGLCTQCGKAPSVKDRIFCEECSAKKLGDHRRIYHERKREGLCTQCGKIPEGKTQMCEECRLNKKKKEIRREIRKEG